LTNATAVLKNGLGFGSVP